MDHLIADVLKIVISDIENTTDLCAFSQTSKRNYEHSKIIIEQRKIAFENGLAENINLTINTICDPYFPNFKANLINIFDRKNIDNKILMSAYSNIFDMYISNKVAKSDLYSLYYVLYKYYKLKKYNLRHLFIFRYLHREFIPKNIGKTIRITHTPVSVEVIDIRLLD